MKLFSNYLAEAEFKASNPVPGDCFDLELSTDTLVESIVSELTLDGDVIIELSEDAVRVMIEHGIVFEDEETSSPINGNAFAPYKRTADPREWFTEESEAEYCDACDRPSDECVCDDHTHVTEAEYQGRNVPLGKPMKGDVKKSKVYVKNAQGNVVKVNFGDKTMKIKKSNPARRKSFRARHNCANPGPRWKARYWSCRAW